MISPDSELGKELAKWETPKRLGGMGANGYEEYPRMLYKAVIKPNGQASVHEMPPNRYLFPLGPIGDQMHDQACLQAEAFTRGCQLTVRNDQEKAKALANGYTLTQDEALAYHERLQQEIGQAAAEAAFAAKRMSDKAQREHASAEAQTSDHVVDVKPAKRGRPVKPVTGSGVQET